MIVTIDIVSDLVCPWCFVGKGRLAQAVALAEARLTGLRCQLNWLPYLLNPQTPPQGEPYRAFLEAKFGSRAAVDRLHSEVSSAGHDAGVDFDFERIVSRPNSLLAHRLLHRAQAIGHRPASIAALVDRLFAAHFQNGEDIGDITTLAAIAAECGDSRELVAAYLQRSDGEQEVLSLADKVCTLGVTGVPFFIIQRRLGIAGAQSPQVLAAAIIDAEP